MLGPIHFYKTARWCYRRKIPWLPRLLDLASRFVFSCWIPHTASLGANIVLGYGALGVVIHDKAVIGDNVHIDQGVTIGGNGREFGVPRVGHNVYIGAGAKILGPVFVGEGAVIGANAVVTHNVPARSVVVGVPARVIRTNIDIDSFLYHRTMQL